MTVADDLALLSSVVLTNDTVAAKGDSPREAIPRYNDIGHGMDGTSHLLVADKIRQKDRAHYAARLDDRHHAGVIVSRQHPMGEAVRGLLPLAKSLKAEDMQDHLEYLSNW